MYNIGIKRKESVIMWIRTLNNNYLVNITTGACIYKQKRGAWYSIIFSKSEFATVELASYSTEEERDSSFNKLTDHLEKRKGAFSFSETSESFKLSKN